MEIKLTASVKFARFHRLAILCLCGGLCYKWFIGAEISLSG